MFNQWKCFLFSGQRILEEAKEKLDENEKRRDENSNKMEKTMKKMIEVKSGIEHLADKLHHLKGVRIDSNEFFIKRKNKRFSLDKKSSSNNGHFNSIERLCSRSSRYNRRKIGQTSRRIRKQRFRRNVKRNATIRCKTKAKFFVFHLENVLV